MVQWSLSFEKVLFIDSLKGKTLFYFMVSKLTRELGCWNNNPKPACLENQTVLKLTTQI